MLSHRICEYYEKDYASALETFAEGQKLDGTDTNFDIWIKRCQEIQNVKGSHVQNVITDYSAKAVELVQYLKALAALPEDSSLVLSICIKWLEPHVTLVVSGYLIPSGPLGCLFSCGLGTEPRALRFLGKRSTTELNPQPLKLALVIPGLSFPHDVKNMYPSSSHYTRNWDKLVGEIKEEEKNEKLEGDAALNKLFQQIYSDGSDEVKRAMNKSFMESGGTVLSTNWSDVGKRKVEINPPDDMEWKQY
uniref:Aa1114 n=1 Tax=Rattus norvegicus TaxID=10116 RepID=Q7TQ12_RAT|nr:Aa1114 [Rattus norvegicus]